MSFLSTSLTQHAIECRFEINETDKKKRKRFQMYTCMCEGAFVLFSNHQTQQCMSNVHIHITTRKRKYRYLKKKRENYSFHFAHTIADISTRIFPVNKQKKNNNNIINNNKQITCELYIQQT